MILDFLKRPERGILAWGPTPNSLGAGGSAQLCLSDVLSPCPFPESLSSLEGLLHPLPSEGAFCSLNADGVQGE